jgi:hypothetical protein
MECPLAVPKLVGSVFQEWTTKRFFLNLHRSVRSSSEKPRHAPERSLKDINSRIAISSLEKSTSWQTVGCLSVSSQVMVGGMPSAGNESADNSSGRQKTCAHQNDIVWTLFDPVSTTFIHFWVILIWQRVKNLKTSLWLKKDRGPKIKFKWPSIKSFTASQIKMI